MERVAVEELDELATNPASSRRLPVGDALGTTDVSLNYYELEPGDSLSGGLHAHHDQEELFCVLAGELTFDVGPDRESVTMAAGEAIRFAPGEYQEGYNKTREGEPTPDIGEQAVALALGAPKGTEDIDSYIYCRECDAETVHTFDVIDERVAVHTCRECGNELLAELTD